MAIEKFELIQPLETQEFACHVVGGKRAEIKLRGGSHWRGPDLDVEQARKLRDWLNDAIPT